MGLGTDGEVGDKAGVCFAKFPSSGFGFGKQHPVVAQIELLFDLNPRG